MQRTIKDYEALTGDQALTPAERRLIEACRAGRPCELGDGQRPEAPSPERQVRGDLLRLLIVGGTPDCGLAPDGVVLIGAWVSGQLDISYLTARGRIDLEQCHFGGRPLMKQSRLQKLSLNGSSLPGLGAARVKIVGSLFLRYLRATGTITLIGADIGGQLSCRGAMLNGAGGDALKAQRIKVGDSMFLAEIQATGTVRVIGADIGGHFDCSKAILNGSGGRALHAQVAKVGDSMFLRGLLSTGTVDLAGAKIGGQLSLRGAGLDGARGRALFAERLHVRNGFFWRGGAWAKGPMRLNGAHVGGLVDDVQCWPSGSDQLLLDGFTYDRIVGDTSAAARLRWLAAGANSEGNFFPQPYVQLAKVLSAMGHDRQARRVRIELQTILARQERAERRVAPNGDIRVAFRSLWRDVLNAFHGTLDAGARIVVGYGHRPTGALAALLVLWLGAWALAASVWNEGSFAPNSDVVLMSDGWQRLLAMDCVGPDPASARDGPMPCVGNPASVWSAKGAVGMDWESFSARGYAADLVVPILTLGQTDAWAPSKDRGWWGWGLWWGRWLFEAAGWIVTALGAAAITGIMQRGREQ